jgi:DNA-binding NarL/FixJ family response regulator
MSNILLPELPYGLRHSPSARLVLGKPWCDVQRSILIVDDSALVRRTLRWVIEDEPGWHVCGEASNGAEGISVAARLKPDVVVLDLSMPVMNGIDAAVQIRKLMPETHLLMFTSYATPAFEQAARSVGIEAFVEKGDPTKLLQTLHGFETIPEKCPRLCNA